MAQSALPKQIRDLITEFAKLPGIGPKSAERLVFYLLRRNQKDIDLFAETLHGLKLGLTRCHTCHNITDQAQICTICADPDRSHEQICVVENSLDVIALEKTGNFAGTYHVLGGAIAPLNNIGPEDLTIDALASRLAKSQTSEVILATNPSLEGEATAMFITKKIRTTHPDLNITRIARGIPVGGELEYADEITLSRALADRLTIPV